MRFPVKEAVIGETLGWILLGGQTSGGNSYTTVGQQGGPSVPAPLVYGFTAPATGFTAQMCVADNRWAIVGENIFIGIGSTLVGGSATGATSAAGGVFKVVGVGGTAIQIQNNGSGIQGGIIGASAPVGPAGP